MPGQRSSTLPPAQEQGPSKSQFEVQGAIVTSGTGMFGMFEQATFFAVSLDA